MVNLKIEQLKILGILIDVIILMILPLLIAPLLIFWWLSSVGHVSTNPIENIISAVPVTIPLSVYVIITNLILMESTQPIIIRRQYQARLKIEWNKIKDKSIVFRDT